MEAAPSARRHAFDDLLITWPAQQARGVIEIDADDRVRFVTPDGRLDVDALERAKGIGQVVERRRALRYCLDAFLDSGLNVHRIAVVIKAAKMADQRSAFLPTARDRRHAADMVQARKRLRACLLEVIRLSRRAHPDDRASERRERAAWAERPGRRANYLEDRERTLASPLEKIMLSIAAFSDEMEREKARQRTHDAMRRISQASHVTGGRVFGYRNVEVFTDALDANGRPTRAHVERQIDDAEAAVVRRMFAMSAAGLGMKAIASAR